MNSSSQKISRSRRIIGALAVVVMLWICGCGDFFAEKPTELRVESILSDLRRVTVVSDANIAVPDIYKKPPKILETKDGVRLFYFTRYHTVDKLSGLIKEQLGYKVSQSPATNQLIINCPVRQEAETVLEFLKQVDVPPIQVKIDCLVSELYADVTMDWETTIMIEDLFGEKITLGGKTVTEVIVGTITQDVLKPAFPGASLRDEARELMGLKVGYSKKDFKALVDLLVSRGYLKILMNPTLEVVNGETAKIEARDYVPLPKEVQVVSGLTIYPYMTTEYKWVVDSLEITPHVFADGYIGLETTVVIGSKSTPEGVKQIPIITERTVQNKENRIRQGESLIIGGIRKSEERSVIRGVPFLKDIPLLGILFSSKDFEERAKEIIFIITPSISTGGIPNKEMVEEIKRKHEPPIVPKGLHETILDPFGFGAREKEQQRKAMAAEQARIGAEAEKAKAWRAVREAKAEAKKAMIEVEKAKVDARKAMNEAEKVKSLLKKLNKSLEESRLNIQKAKKEAEKAKAQAQKAPNNTQSK